MLVTMAGMDKAEHLRHRKKLDRAWAAEVKSRNVVYPFVSDKYRFFGRKEHHLLLNHNDHSVSMDFSQSKHGLKAFKSMTKKIGKLDRKPDEKIFRDTFNEDKIWVLKELAEHGELDDEDDDDSEVSEYEVAENSETEFHSLENSPDKSSSSSSKWNVVEGESWVVKLKQKISSWSKAI